ncbi:TetR/AcrR family transcriptional regulator [Leucobacter sp. GX24907]
MSTDRTSTHVAPRRHDPAGRRRAILNAAAELITEHGTPALTHRAVAARAGVALGSTTQYFSSIDELRELALKQLADEIDDELASIERLLDEHPLDSDPVVDLIHDFLTEPWQVHSALALMHAGVTDPTRRALARRWFDRLVEILATRVGREQALALAVYFDGVTVHAGLHHEPLDRAHLARVIRALTEED